MRLKDILKMIWILFHPKYQRLILTMLRIRIMNLIRRTFLRWWLNIIMWSLINTNRLRFIYLYFILNVRFGIVMIVIL